MPNAVMHVILTIIVVDVFRDYFLPKQYLNKFPRWMVLFAGIAGLIPDIDMPISWVYDLITGSSFTFHGGISHSYIIAVVILFIAGFFYAKNQNTIALLFALLSFGYGFHITLDVVFLGTYMPFLPFSDYTFPSRGFSYEQMAGFDALLLVAWLVHEEIKHKLTDYI
jgi:membrane-bound metal-dependent hydrolase YbcI (DUF457 family)